MMRVLLVKTSSMGDILHSLPALTDAQQAIPDIQFDWVVEEGFAQIPTWHSAVNQVIPVAIRRWRKIGFLYRSEPNVQNFARNYKQLIMTQSLMRKGY